MVNKLILSFLSFGNGVKPVFRDWFIKKAGKTIEAAVEPTKAAIQKSVETKSDWMAKLLRLGIVGFLTLLAFREEPRGAKDRGLPESTSVVVNNYIYERRSEHDSEH